MDHEPFWEEAGQRPERFFARCAFFGRAVRWACAVWLGLVLVNFGNLAAQTNSAESGPAKNTQSIPTLEETARKFYGSERARKTLQTFPSRGARTDLSIPPKSPADTTASFTLMEGLEAEVILHEPIVRQPLFLNFDARGRLWVVQFIQYPYPAGVKVIDFDDQFHAVYDKVPPPPPRHDRGADKITIHEDRDGDGEFETHKTFLEGLNMVTAVEQGRGGVWVLNPPYLVFWPDANHDDVPDGEPMVHLAGFGLEDTHSAANSLRWGPDGWLYGAQGSGVSSTITRPGLDEANRGFYFKGQVIWRYHPQKRIFELFAEGGGNTFGLEFDSAGRAWSGINGSNHRGFHFVPGGYYAKGFGEHGYFTNPNTYGYFSPMPHDREAPRFSHTFVVYEGAALGPRFDGKLIAPVPLHNHVMLSELIPFGSTYRTRDLGRWLDSNDPWFRPVDIKVGPDGAVYLADWYDTRLTHMDPRDTWDRAHGRVYRIKAKDHPHRRAVSDLSGATPKKLLEFLSHPNKWFRQMALRLLWDRPESRLVPQLAALARQPENPHALDALWALHACGGFDSATAIELLNHKQPLVRAWVVRLIGDLWGTGRTGVVTKMELPRGLAETLAAMALIEPAVQVRSQLASTARRLESATALPILFALAQRDEDASDPHIPLLLWWALETHAVAHRDRILAVLCRPESPDSLWSRRMMNEHLLARLARRYATEPTDENQRALAALLRAAPNAAVKSRIMEGINEAFKGGAARQLITSLEQALDQPELTGPADGAQLALAVRRSDVRMLGQALAFVARQKVPLQERLTVVVAFGETRQSAALPVLLGLLSNSNESALRQAALAALGHFESEEVADEILSRWASFDPSLKRQAVEVLCTRKSWAGRFLRAAGASGTISKADIPDEVAMRIRLFRDKELDEMCDRYFGKASLASTAEKQNR
ncbi:MAG: PVC-type heme-binding CxxCH protein, partial [Verrucomicrobiota bacterium]